MVKLLSFILIMIRIWKIIINFLLFENKFTVKYYNGNITFFNNKKQKNLFLYYIIFFYSEILQW